MDIDGDTFVAFLDISGFKQLMKDDIRAWEAIDNFYTAGYKILSLNNTEIGGVFVSDCGILFYGYDLRGSSIHEKKNALNLLLQSIKYINRKMCDRNFILTTSIAYGYFSFQERLETENMRKIPIYGNAYLTSYLDNETGSPRIQPGQCRIVKGDIPDDVLNIEYLRRGRSNDDHYYYYWMVDQADDINGFEVDYKDSYNLKYRGMLEALKKYNRNI